MSIQAIWPKAGLLAIGARRGTWSADHAATADQRLSDDSPEDVVSPLADHHQGSIPVKALDGELLGVAVAAVHMHRRERALIGNLGRVHLREPGLQVSPPAGVGLSGSPICQQPGGLQLHGHVGQLVLDSLETGYLLAEGLPLAG